MACTARSDVGTVTISLIVSIVHSNVAGVGSSLDVVYIASTEKECFPSCRLANVMRALHIFADDALHLYTAWAVDYQYFLVHDHKIITRVKSKQHEDLKIIDLGDQNDIQRLESELSI